MPTTAWTDNATCHRRREVAGSPCRFGVTTGSLAGDRATVGELQADLESALPRVAMRNEPLNGPRAWQWNDSHIFRRPGETPPRGARAILGPGASGGPQLAARLAQAASNAVIASRVAR